jgi:hypothetical protein
MLDNPAVPVLILNVFIIGACLAIALTLSQPLAILGLFWIQSLPQPEYEEGGLVGISGEQGEVGEYDTHTMGFSATLKK